jgi:hypothetical protein
MITFSDTHVDLQQFTRAIRAARLSYRSEEQSDSSYDSFDQIAFIGLRDAALLSSLTRAGNGEDKFLATIHASVFIRASQEWWAQLDTYKIATTRLSESVMHRSRPFLVTDFDPDTDLHSIAIVNELYTAWKAEGGKRNDKQSALWRRLRKSIPRGILYTSYYDTNYRSLRNVYHQRCIVPHRIEEWALFGAWVEGLPHSWLITGVQA